MREMTVGLKPMSVFPTHASMLESAQYVWHACFVVQCTHSCYYSNWYYVLSLVLIVCNYYSVQHRTFSMATPVPVVLATQGIPAVTLLTTVIPILV